jgi:Tol biopolymer transport system component/serine/threonine protein kinase
MRNHNKMTPERWHRVRELFQSALEREPRQREAFLDRACAGDEELRKEVESLIASHDKTGSFIDAPAFEAAAQFLAEEKPELTPGQRIGHYKILSLLGAGGMGEVYLAQDTKLGREIALKLLPAQFTTDGNRLRRFKQEAHMASALNHPNICMIHEVGETEDDRHYIAMEYVDGVTLREHITETRMEIGEALDVAMQVGSALAAAHQAGIVHRDIKPENIMLRRDGYIKVLDFGLAKLTEPQATDLPATPAAQVKTDTGVVMGTSRYMSPEQARGLAVDLRTDIWSWAVVIYEMVTGRAPFEGTTTSDVIVSILEREPPPITMDTPEVAVEIQLIVNKGLCKEREERYQTVKEMALDLKSLKQELEFEAKHGRYVQQEVSSNARAERGEGLTSVETARGSAIGIGEAQAARTTSSAEYLVNEIKRHQKGVVLVSLALVFAIAAAAWIRFSNRSYESSKPPAPPMKTVPFTSSPGRETYAAFSPDGRQIAFSWEVESGKGHDTYEGHDIFVKLVGAGEPLRLTTNPGDDIYPTWSPDGRYIAFVRQAGSDGGIFMVPALGGPERRLQPSYPRIDWWLTSLSWSPDGKLIAFPAADSPQESPGLFLLSVDTLEKRRLTSTSEQYLGDGYPVFSPDGQTLAFIRQSSELVMDIYLVPVSGGEPRRLTFDDRQLWGLDWTPDGREIVFSSMRGGGCSLWRIPAIGGIPEPLAVGGDFAQFPSISREGNRLAYTQTIFDANIWKFEVSDSMGKTTSPTEVISSTRDDHGPQISPDGKRIAFDSARSGSYEVWMCEADGSNPIQLTSFGGGDPRWSPDGRQIVFESRAASHYANIYVINAEGGTPRRLTTDSSAHVVPSWSRDGRWIYFTSNKSNGQDWQLWKMPAEGGQAVQVTQHGGMAAVESSDGKFIYYAKLSDPGIWRMPVQGGEENLVLKQLVPAFWGNWTMVDKGIYFVDLNAKRNPTIEFFNIATGRMTQVAAPEKLPVWWNPGLAVSPDGRWVLYAQVDQDISDIMLVENFR